MALPTSGPLTLSDIQTEFGGTNPISLNEYYAGGGLVPAGATGTYGAVPSSGEISIRNFYGTTSIRDFQLAYTNDEQTNTRMLRRQASDSTFTWVTGVYNYRLGGTLFTDAAYITKLSTAAGSVVDQNYMIGIEIRDITTDSSNNLYMLGLTSGTPFFAKLNSSYVTQWGYTTSVIDNPFTIEAAPSGSIYAGGADASNTARGLILKLSSTPTLSWASSIVSGSSPALYVVQDIEEDSSGNVYAVGTGQFGTGPTQLKYIVKYNSGGTVLWQRSLTNTVTSMAWSTISISGDGSVYVAGVLPTGTGQTGIELVKFNSSGTSIWRRAFNSSSPSSHSATVPRITTDNDGNIYLAFSQFVLTATSTTESYRYIYLAKIDASGNLLWSRYFTKRNDGTSSVILMDVAGLSLTDTGDILLSFQFRASGVAGVTFFYSGMTYKIPDTPSVATYPTYTTAYSGITYEFNLRSSISFGISISTQTLSTYSTTALTFTSPSLGSLTSTTIDFTTEVPIGTEVIVNDVQTVT